MKRWLFLLPLAMALAAAGGALACLYLLGDEDETSDAIEAHVASSALGESRPYRVHLPDSYQREPKRRYPVVYVLDGGAQDAHTADSSALMARIGAMPEAIVVGIPSVSAEHRQRDYTPPGMRQDLDTPGSAFGQGDRFLAFLRSDLIPDIERRYRANDARMLAGYSRGGLFVLYALSAAPDLFRGYLANSPALWRDDDAMVSRFDRFLVSQPRTDARLFLSLGTAENEKMTRAFRSALDRVRAHAPPMLCWHAQFTPDAGHNHNAALATPVGLRWIFDPGWVPPSGNSACGALAVSLAE
ncbi:alpha/beta hydrolase [Arenimonas sp.]|uniref:alpha/beta hydrolase n=1 Tax=Arenimonas sp. TaxID=1872635 RepID=UPI0039E6F11C